MQVFNTIPKAERPHEGNAELATSYLLPILEKLFEMQPRGPVPGSQAWMTAAKDNPNCLTFEQLVTIPDDDYILLRLWIKYQKHHCSINASGYPPKKGPVPNAFDKYEKKSRFNVSVRTVVQNAKMPYVRNASHIFAINALKACGWYPVKCPAGKTPTGKCARADVQ